jgi:YcxB-like protein
MMTKEITASYVWTADELIKAQENHDLARCRPGFRAGLYFLAFMAILAGCGSYLVNGWAFPTVLFPLGGIYILFLRKYDVRWGIRRRFKKRPDRDARVVWTINDDNLRIKTEESETRQNWNQIYKARKARNGFLLYLNDAMFIWLPVTSFESEDDQVKTEALLRIKIKDFARIR